MDRIGAIQQYEAALKAGQKYYHDAIRHSQYPYPLVLDEILDEHTIVGRAELGVVNIPSELNIGKISRAHCSVGRKLYANSAREQRVRS